MRICFRRVNMSWNEWTGGIQKSERFSEGTQVGLNGLWELVLTIQKWGASISKCQSVVNLGRKNNDGLERGIVDILRGVC